MRYVLIPLLLLFAIIAGGTAALIIADVTLQEVRDVFIIIYAVMGILFFLISIILAFGMFVAVRVLTRIASEAYEEQAKPMLEDVRGSVTSFRSGVEFATDQAVSPVIRVVSMARGVRRGVGAVTGFARRGR